MTRASSTNELHTRMVVNPLPNTHGEFLEAFIDVACERKGDDLDDVDNDKMKEAGIPKRQRLMRTATARNINHPNMSAPVARYALGGDDNLYMQLGLSVLHTTSTDLPLAPAALYNIDVVHAIREGMQRTVLAEVNRRNKESEAKLQQVRARLVTIFGVMGLGDLIEETDQFSSVLNTSPYKADQREEFKELLYRLYNAMNSILATKIKLEICTGTGGVSDCSKLKNILKDALAGNEFGDALSGDEAGDMASAADGQVTSNASIVHYALARGLCGHRGPMEEATTAPTDRLLPYTAPKDIGLEVARARGMRVPAGAWTAPEPNHDSAAAVDEAMVAFGGNYAIDDANKNGKSFGVVRDARQVRWEPKGKNAVALATTAALEHAVARCTQLLDDSRSTLSAEAKSAITKARLCLKLRQMDSLHKLACAAEDGEVLHSPPTMPMVTRPTTTLRGKLHFAHDAGHHAAPATATVLADHRWTAEHARADAAFRKANAANATPTIAVYKAPAPHELGYLPVNTGTTAARADLPIDPTDEYYFHGTIFNSIKKLIEYGLYYADVPDPKTIKATLGGASSSDDALGNAETRRSGIWNEMLRDIAVSTDRLWTFVRTLSGLIGEDADSLLVTADEASASAARDLQAQHKAMAEKVAAFQTKIVETLISGMMKDSGLRLDTDAQDAPDKLVVVNAETAKQINDLASGESGRPFFEANVALRALSDKNKGGKHKLGEVVAQLNDVARQLHTALAAERLSPQTAGASLAELSMPRNAYFVKLRTDTTAAIRSGFDKFSVEREIRGIGRISLWELVEGCDHTLCTRFAEFVGHVLIQNRTSTGISAMYSSRQQLVINAAQAGNALQRLINHAGHYRRTYPRPDFGSEGDTATFNQLRINYFETHKETTETWIDGGAASSIRYAQELHSKQVERVARPGDQTPGWLRPLTVNLRY